MAVQLPGPSAVDYHFGPYRFDGRLRRLYKDAELITLTPKAVDTLVALMERAGRVVEKDELLRAVWEEIVVGEDTLAQNISTLRRALGDDANHPQFIATVPRRGYKFVGSVRIVPSQTAGQTLVVRPSERRMKGGVVALVGAAVLAGAIGGFAVYRVPSRNPPRTSVHFTILEPEFHRFSAGGGMLALSPDGAYLSFVAIDANGSASLWLRPLTSNIARPLDGTEGAANPFWSPDSRSIGFFAERRVKAVDVVSGAVRVIGSLASSRSMGGTWSRDGQILFSVPGDGTYLVAASGGSPQRLTLDLDAECEGCATWPYFLPDGRRFLYTVASSDTSRSGIYLGEIGKPGSQRLLDALSSCVYVAPGLLIYARSGTLYAQGFDTRRLRITGMPIPLSDSVAYNARTGRVIAAVSEAGVLAFRRPLITELVWVNRSGTPLSRVAPPATYMDFSIAPDGRRVAAARVDPRTGTSDVWVFEDGRELRVTDDAAWDGDPVWSEDGEQVVYSSRRGGKWRIYRRPASAAGQEELLLEADQPVAPLQTLRSRHIVYAARRANVPFDVWALDHGTSRPLARIGGFYPSDARISPDERWLAYGTPETTGGVWSQTIYVSSPPFGEIRRAIAEAASTPRWRADGRELFYLSKDSSVVAIPVDPQRTPSDLPGGVLFHASGLAPTGVSGVVYDVSSDGQRFVLKREVGSSPIHVVLNWDTRPGP
jgi:DNA-binding winged helix-turn-helix (wHTH) protein/Tol biopolymer transport system component